MHHFWKCTVRVLYVLDFNASHGAHKFDELQWRKCQSRPQGPDDDTHTFFRSWLELANGNMKVLVIALNRSAIVLAAGKPTAYSYDLL